ncbi:polysaccharide pyruvyl transferase family protein [Rhodococcus sp. H29-C3]|uniref:polysaccharide pyruvyl transferase family protein n=1 Tax=Rhodococcus sp. H29-C3 TaxID=3046307 RepID=UPI0024BBBF3D|nr:polysaccharide pyruvyl transferase family protein [Rhodococcus sp. H29-C3]MDJ0360852.1 polysaccharide pyruvyl transferase family protein [Rhodococcus sp. H29-C3]
MASSEAPSMSADKRELRILLENGEYWLSNKGDLAILDITIRRIAQRWPSARIGVLTSRPSLLRAFEPDAEPVNYLPGGEWSKWNRLGRVPGFFGPTVAGPVLRVSVAAMTRIERLVRTAAAPVRAVKPSASESSTAKNPARVALSRDGGRLPNAVADASLVIAIGGGYLADVDKFQTMRTLDLLEYAVTHRIPAVMLGQGIGPIHDPDLIERAAAVLPKVDFIAVREDRRGPDLLRSLGVRSEHIVVTGDDAVELAYSTRRQELGTDIGVCLRVADYAPVGASVQDTVGRIVRGVAAETGAMLVPLIVSEHDSEDRRSTLPLLTGFPAVARPLGRFARARAVAREVGRCRIVVTGAYHVAVFALSQGIPVVALSTSSYYDDKFGGLGSMFGSGIDVVRLDREDVDDLLTRAMRNAWDTAHEARSVLLARAVEQIDASRLAFARAAELVERDATAPRETNHRRIEPPTFPK